MGRRTADLPALDADSELVQSEAPRAAASPNPPLVRAWKAISRSAICMVGAICFLSRYLTIISADTNRFFLDWSRLDGLAIILLILCLGLAAAAVDSLLSRTKWMDLRR